MFADFKALPLGKIEVIQITFINKRVPPINNHAKT